MRGVICGISLAGVSSGVMGCFIMMWMHGSVEVCEPVVWIRAVEVGVAGAFAVYGVYYTIYRLRRF